MREAAVPGYRLNKARFSTKVLTSLGMIGLLLGLMSSAAMTAARTGLTASQVARYYLGSPGAENGDDLSSILAASGPRPFGELAEVTHLHLMGGSLMLFLLCHLLSVCDVTDRTRTVLYLASFVSFITTFTLPWLIVYAAPVFSYAFGPSLVTFVICLLILCVIPLREMWFKRKSSPIEIEIPEKPLHVVHGSKIAAS